MRILFLALCMISGLLAGLWWAGLLPMHKPGPQSEDPAAQLHSVLQSQPGALSDPGPSDATDDIPQSAEPQSTELTGYNPFSYNKGIMRVAPAVVSIYASNISDETDNSGLQSDSLTTEQTQSLDTSQGSGVIVDVDGIVLTNLHLVDGFNKLVVELRDGRQFDATVIGSDQETDLAVVKIEASMLTAVELGEATPLKVGDIVLAIGNPFGVGQTVTQGIVSATRRRIASGSVWQNFIQIDAAINPGNSGGALINPLGQLVGVNTAVFRGDNNAVGIGYAIPAELLAQVVPQIIERGFVSRGWLGLGVEDLNMFPSLAETAQQGVVITAVRERGPAYNAGVRPMDIVVQIGEQAVTSATQLLLAVSALPPGATVKLVLLRSDDDLLQQQVPGDNSLVELMFKVVLGSRPDINQTSQ